MIPRSCVLPFEHTFSHCRRLRKALHRAGCCKPLRQAFTHLLLIGFSEAELSEDTAKKTGNQQKCQGTYCCPDNGAYHAAGNCEPQPQSPKPERS